MKLDSPTFVVTGQPNEGKTTVLSTLAEDDSAEVGILPGTTTEARRYAIAVEGRDTLVFYDTPGFQQPSALLDWLRAHDRQFQNPARAFVEEFRNTGHFPDECEILEPIARGAAVIHVVDASRPLREVDRQEIEILRLCGNPRIALINIRSGEETFLEDWQALLTRDFNLRRTFHPHRSTFADRVTLLDAIRLVIPEWETSIERARDALVHDRRLRRGRAADQILDFLAASLSMTEREPVHGGVVPDPKGLREKIETRLRAREADFREQQRRLFRHTSERWVEPRPLEADVFSREVWQFFGLSRNQLAIAGAVMGGATGGAVDLLAGGTTLGGFVIGGALLGGAAGWFGAGQAVRVKLPPLAWGPLRMQAKEASGHFALAQPDPRSNLPWILLDRALLYTTVCMTWSHGRREVDVDPERESDGKRGYSASLPADARRSLARWFALVGKADRLPLAIDREAPLRILNGILDAIDKPD